MNIDTLIKCSLALIALINPISKIFIITTLAEKYDERELRRVVVKSSSVAVTILLIFALVGNFLLQTVFQVHIYAFKLAGGIVLVLRGFEALNKGLFFELRDGQQLEDISIVPLASPMIAGPATITAAVSFPAKYGMIYTLISIVIALLINLSVMYFSRLIGKVLIKNNIMGALIRITGLIVATIGIQMILDGISTYIATIT